MGHPIGAWTVIPSTQGRVDRPLPALAARVGLPGAPVTATLTTDQPTDARATANGRFAFDRPESIQDRHVLMVDDTWTTGARLQSMALSLRSAGAAAVSGFVLARWLRADWPVTADFIRGTPHRDFNPRLCPVTGELCP